MSDDPAKPALSQDNPDPPRGDEGEKGLGTETGAEGAAADTADSVVHDIPERRGDVRYPDVEKPDEHRPTAVPQEGHVEEDPDTADDAATGAKD